MGVVSQFEFLDQSHQRAVLTTVQARFAFTLTTFPSWKAAQKAPVPPAAFTVLIDTSATREIDHMDDPRSARLRLLRTLHAPSAAAQMRPVNC